MAGTDVMTYEVPGMTCGHCVSAVEGEIGRLPSVSTVRVDLATKQVTVEGANLDDTAIRAAIEEAGFEAA